MTNQAGTKVRTVYGESATIIWSRGCEVLVVTAKGSAEMYHPTKLFTLDGRALVRA